MPACTYLFVPADRPERFAKASASGADAVIVDLEDAVAPDAKEGARRALAEWLASGQAPVIVRINGGDTPWLDADLALCARPGVAGVMLPKAADPDELARAAAPGKPLLALIETAAGFDRLRDVARAPGVQRLVFGTIDFQLDLGIGGDGEELLMFRSQIVLASRLAGLAAPVDGVCTAIADEPRLRAEALRARRLGFGAKLCIHPQQVEVVRRSFSPSDEEIAWAERVMQACRGAGAVALDGRMIDKPVRARAEAILRSTQAPR